MDARRAIAGWLERGALARVWPRVLERAHGHVAAHLLARPLAVPAGVRVVTVGGATLGGSGKTRVALAAVFALTAAGHRVALVGHGYRGNGRRAARVVLPHDALADVGDEALLCARALGDRAPVVIGPSRQAAVDRAASLANVLVLDGPLQLAPVRAALSLLAVDRDAPWGAGALPPAGDLRAPRDALVAAADHLVPVAALADGGAAWLDGTLVPLAALPSVGLGLFTAIARPERLLGPLRQTGLEFATVVHAPDHGPLSPGLVRRLVRAPVDLWLATAKCALHLENAGVGPVAVLDGGCDLPPAVARALLYTAERSGA